MRSIQNRMAESTRYVNTILTVYVQHFGSDQIICITVNITTLRTIIQNSRVTCNYATINNEMIHSSIHKNTNEKNVLTSFSKSIFSSFLNSVEQLSAFHSV